MSTTREFWEKVYGERKPDEVSWFQVDPTRSLALLQAAGLAKDAAFIDVGGGASVLVDRLLSLGYTDLSVLDISAKALDYAKERLDEKAPSIHWIEADATAFAPPKAYDLWHDRAVFHFLTAPEDRAKYLGALRKGLRIGGTLVLAAFAADGPEKCSGLPVCRYGQEAIVAELGRGFELVGSAQETHRTPWDTEQRFNYFRFMRLS